MQAEIGSKPSGVLPQKLVNVWDSLADLLKTMKLRGVFANDTKEVRKIVQHLLQIMSSLHVVSEIAKRQRRASITCCFSALTTCNHSFLDRAQELVRKAINEHAKYTIAELDRSRPVKKGAATRKGQQNQSLAGSFSLAARRQI